MCKTEHLRPCLKIFSGVSHFSTFGYLTEILTSVKFVFQFEKDYHMCREQAHTVTCNYLSLNLSLFLNCANIRKNLIHKHVNFVLLPIYDKVECLSMIFKISIVFQDFQEIVRIQLFA